MVGTDGQVQGISGTQPKLILISETSRAAELHPRYGKHPEAFRSQGCEFSQRRRAMHGGHASAPHFDRKGGGKLRHDPVADDEAAGILLVEPRLNTSVSASSVSAATRSDVSK